MSIKTDRLEVAFEFQKQLNPLVAEQVITAGAADMLVGMFSDLLIEYSDRVAEGLHGLARNWEAKVGPDDDRLYSLGIRHAVDYVYGYDAAEKRNAELKEQEDE